MADEVEIQKTRQLGHRQVAIRALDHALFDLLPEDYPRTSAETSLLNEIHSLTKNDHLNAAELWTLERIVGRIKAVITERKNSNWGALRRAYRWSLRWSRAGRTLRQVDDRSFDG
jgi:hypothetical protein